MTLPCKEAQPTLLTSNRISTYPERVNLTYIYVEDVMTMLTVTIWPDIGGIITHQRQVFQ